MKRKGKNMSKKIWLDLDGTVYDLYSIPNWLEDIQEEKEGLFLKGDFLGIYSDFLKEAERLLLIGYEFGIITWLPLGASPEYEEICRIEKMKWIKKFLPFIHDINIISYGIPKQNAIKKRSQLMILIDDNSEVCRIWETNKMRKSINLKENFGIIQALKTLVE